MKRMFAIVAAAAMAAGCQTRITAEKMPERMLPVYRTVSIGGTNAVYIAGYERASGGWYATARSPLWAAEELRGLQIGVGTNGTVTLALDGYSRDLSTNAVAMTRVMCDAASDIAAKVCAAVVSHGGTVAADGVATLVRQYIEARGGASTASVTCSDGSCAITDTASGLTCAAGGCYAK